MSARAPYWLVWGRAPDRSRLAREALASGPGGCAGQGKPARASGHNADGPRRDRRLRVAPAAGRERRDDPQPLTAALDGLIGDQGWALGRGDRVGVRPVGGDRRARPGRAHPAGDAGRRRADRGQRRLHGLGDPARLLAAQLIRRLNAELGDGTGAPGQGPRAGQRRPRRPGEWRVRGRPRPAGHLWLRQAWLRTAEAGGSPR